MGFQAKAKFELHAVVVVVVFVMVALLRCGPAVRNVGKFNMQACTAANGMYFTESTDPCKVVVIVVVVIVVVAAGGHKSPARPGAPGPPAKCNARGGTVQCDLRG